MNTIAKQLGAKIKIARKRRGYSQKKLADLVYTSTPTIHRIEKGHLGTSVGILFHVLWVLQLESDLLLLADDSRDKLGLTLANRNLPKHVHNREEDNLDF